MFDVPDDLRDWQCALEAVDTRANIARSYLIRTAEDLFGHIVVELRWGRIGRPRQGIALSFRDMDAARSFVRRTLLRRASAPRRIGVAYAQVGPDAPGRAAP